MTRAPPSIYSRSFLCNERTSEIHKLTLPVPTVQHLRCPPALRIFSDSPAWGWLFMLLFIFFLIHIFPQWNYLRVRIIRAITHLCTSHVLDTRRKSSPETDIRWPRIFYEWSFKKIMNTPQLLEQSFEAQLIEVYKYNKTYWLQAQLITLKLYMIFLLNGNINFI